MEGWGAVPLTAVAATGNVTQLYPAFASVGVNPFAPMTSGDAIRKPCGGVLGSCQVQTDGANDGAIELYDISGLEAGADVSSGTTITNAQLVAALAAKRAKLIWRANVLTSQAAEIEPSIIGQGFMKGLAARFVAGAGTCSLNLTVEGGFIRTTSPGT